MTIHGLAAPGLLFIISFLWILSWTCVESFCSLEFLRENIQMLNM